MALTLNHVFIGAISLFVVLSRGSIAYVSFQHEKLLGRADEAASYVAAAQARASNAIAGNNAIVAALVGARFAVEADAMTVKANALLACPKCPSSPDCVICKQSTAALPRVLGTLAWTRAKQVAVARSLSELSSALPKLAGQEAANLVRQSLGDESANEEPIRIVIKDPSQTIDLWSAANTDVACDLASKEVLKSPMLGHAFPKLVSKNLLQSLPKTLVSAMPSKLCSAGQSAASKPKLAEIREVAERTRDDCREFEAQMRCAVAAADGRGGACGGMSASSDGLEASETLGRLRLPAAARPYVSCRVATLRAPLASRDTRRSSSASRLDSLFLAGGDPALGTNQVFHNADGQLETCTFDRDACVDKQLEKNSDAYLNQALGLPSVVSSVKQVLGGETHAPASGGSSPNEFCACACATQNVTPSIRRLTGALHTIVSLGAQPSPTGLDTNPEYCGCAKWYFPDRKGPFASVDPKSQSFVAAWKWAPVLACPASVQTPQRSVEDAKPR